MKLLLLAFAIVFTSLTFAEENRNYDIISANIDSTILGDSIVVTGIVTYEKKPPLDNFGKVASLDFKMANIVARSGGYAIKYHKSAKGFYFFQSNYKEVVIDLSSYDAANKFEININAEEFTARFQLEKPVVYLYSPYPTKTELTLSPNGELSFTYPQYDKNWQIETQENGNIKNLKTGKIHPYLFWEANQTQLDFKKEGKTIEGYVISTDTAVQFLEKQLASLGLNERESTDFITYWAPRLMQKQFATIQFMIGKDYDEVFGGIESTTLLDYQLRIGMLYEITEVKPSEKVVKPTPIIIKKRHGFSLIEWGGIELKNKLILL
ncbi:MAG: hypothetical protein AB8B72_05665 [Crocinitomicaceae bacterium]